MDRQRERGKEERGEGWTDERRGGRVGRIGKRDDGKGQRGRGTDRQREGKEKEQTERKEGKNSGSV